MIQEVTGVKVLSLHHDISTVTGEEVVLFTLAESPDYRQPKKRTAIELGVGVVALARRGAIKPVADRG